jgi:hypothetical protein
MREHAWTLASQTRILIAGFTKCVGVSPGERTMPRPEMSGWDVGTSPEGLEGSQSLVIRDYLVAFVCNS